MITEHRTFCRICPVLCGLVVRTDGSRVLDVRGDREHPVTLGYSCPKGRALPEFHHHPHRLNHPMIRGGEVSWPWMIDDLASSLARIIDESGPDAVAAYNGTWSWMDALGRTKADQFMRHIASHSRYSATTVDAIARLVVAELMTGMASLMPMIDTDNAGLTILIGTNPVVSHGHAGAMVDPIVVMRRIAREHGLWVVDPRRSETARLATRHLAIRPGADPALLAYVRTAGGGRAVDRCARRGAHWSRHRRPRRACRRDPSRADGDRSDRNRLHHGGRSEHHRVVGLGDPDHHRLLRARRRCMVQPGRVCASRSAASHDFRRRAIGGPTEPA
ncbi:MAG: hypothetical protein E6G39_06930 [Actinobacteria bacterium]|nr:MAG: hypothetical protein E6G39_06930 [Actinomycetota bacterium]